MDKWAALSGLIAQWINEPNNDEKRSLTSFSELSGVDYKTLCNVYHKRTEAQTENILKIVVRALPMSRRLLFLKEYFPQVAGYFENIIEGNTGFSGVATSSALECRVIFDLFVNRQMTLDLFRFLTGSSSQKLLDKFILSDIAEVIDGVLVPKNDNIFLISDNSSVAFLHFFSGNYDPSIAGSWHDIMFDSYSKEALEESIEILERAKRDLNRVRLKPESRGKFRIGVGLFISSL